MADEPDHSQQEPFSRKSREGASPSDGQDAGPGSPELQGAGGEDPRLQEAERKAREHHDAWLRAKAEAENVRKRAQIDVANAHKYALETFAAELLPVKDALEAALGADNATPDALRGGVELTLKQLAAAFDKGSLREINPVGEKFDPHRHQAISMLPSDREPFTIISVLQKGYLLNDRVIRPALVTVAKLRDA
jgi:molecular chaperone GrpE